jgi:apolipoprotein N-acyltransferase
VKLDRIAERAPSGSKAVERMAPWLAAVASGLLLGLPLSLAKLSAAYVPFAWIWLVPMLFWPGPHARAWKLFLCAWIAGTVATAVGIYGIAYALGNLAVAYFPLAGLLWAMPVAGFLLLRPLLGARRALWTLPFLWPLAEWAIQRVEGLPPFLHLSAVQANAVWLIQFADLTGEWGITAWVVLFNILLYRALKQPRPGRLRSCAIVLAAMLLPVFAYSAWSISRAKAGKPYRVLAVQPFLNRESVNATQLLERETYLTDLAVAREKPDLIVWPEGAIDFTLADDMRVRNFVAQAVSDWGTPLLAGSWERRGRRLSPSWFARASASNAAFLLAPGPPGSGPNQTDLSRPHLKRRLAPFGEAMPYTQRFPWLNNLFRKWHPGEMPLIPGRDFLVFQYRTDSGEPMRIGPVICWESLYARDLATVANRGAQVLVVMANDFLWGGSSISYLHSVLGRLRAIETHRPVIRASTSGPSLAVDGRGRELACPPVQRQTTLAYFVSPEEDLTFYSQHPDWFPVFCAAVLVLFAATGIFYRLRHTGGLEN